MSWWARVPGYGLVFIMMGVSVMMNFRFGYGFGQTELDAWAYGLAGGAADCLKPLLLLFLVPAFQRREYWRALAAGLLLITCCSYSLLSGIGFTAVNRADTAGERSVTSDSYARHKRLLADAESELKDLPSVKPAEAIRLEVEGLLAKPIYRSRKSRKSVGTVGGLTGNCEKRSRWRKANEHCTEWRSLQKDLVTAKRAEELRLKISQLNAQLSQSVSTNKVVEDADPQVTMLHGLTGFPRESIQVGLTLITAILVELVSGLGLFVLARGRQESQAQQVQPQQEEAAPKASTQPSFELPDLRISQ
ncbi:MAG: hypothetical protein RIC14_07765 [Filomicrobium sp.]